MNTIGEQIIITSKDFDEKIVLQVCEHCVVIKQQEDMDEHQQKCTRRFELEPTLYEFVRGLIDYGRHHDGIVIEKGA